MKFIILLLVISVLSVNNSFGNERGISKAQNKSNQECELIKNFKIRTQLIAIIPTKNSTFNDGRLTKVNHYSKDGKLMYSSDYEAFSDSLGTIFSYFNDGYLQSVKKIASESNQLLITYDYDSTGKIIKLVNSGSEYKEYECKYDMNGNLIQKLGYIIYPKTDDSGAIKPNYNQKQLVDEFIYKFDKNDNILEEKTKLNGKLINQTKYKYNERNQKLEESNLYLGNKVKYIFHYDSDSKLTDITRINIDGSKSYFKVEYDYYN